MSHVQLHYFRLRLASHEHKKIDVEYCTSSRLEKALALVLARFHSIVWSVEGSLTLSGNGQV